MTKIWIHLQISTFASSATDQNSSVKLKSWIQVFNCVPLSSIIKIFFPRIVYLPITNLTMQYEQFSELHQILHDLPLLNYLRVRHRIYEHDSDEDLSIRFYHAVHFQKLNVDEFFYPYENTRKLLQCTHNLEHLILSSCGNSQVRCLSTARPDNIIITKLKYILIVLSYSRYGGKHNFKVIFG